MSKLAGEGSPGRTPAAPRARRHASHRNTGDDGHVRKPKAHKEDLKGAVPCVITAGQHRREHIQYYVDKIE